MAERFDHEEDPAFEKDVEYDDDDPNNPRHPDFDLSDSAAYDYERPADLKPWFLQRWMVILVSSLLLFSLLLPMFLRLS